MSRTTRERSRGAAATGPAPAYASIWFVSDAARSATRRIFSMRDRTGDPRFLLRKRIERHLTERFPDQWIPLYSMVTFTHMSYSEALELGRIQDGIMEEVMDRDDIESQWDSDAVSRHALQLAADRLQGLNT